MVVLDSKSDLLKVPSGGVLSGRHGSGADGRPNSSFVAAGVPERIGSMVCTWCPSLVLLPLVQACACYCR